MRSNPTGGQFRIEKSDGSLSAYPFYIGADGTALAYYYNAAGALKILLHTDNTSYFGNSLSVGYSTYATTSYMLDVNGTGRFISSVNVQNFLTVSSASTLVAPSSGKSIEMVYRTDGANDYAFIQTYDRTNSVFKQLRITGSTLILNEGGGNIGIGTTTTDFKVNISSASTTWNSAPAIAFLDTVVTSDARNWLIGNVATSYGNFVIASSTTQGGAPTTPRLTIFRTGQLQLNAYTASTSFSGTAAGYLAFDSSGNVITVAGVAATDSTKLPLAGGTLTGALQISMGYPYLQLNDTIGSPTKSGYIQYGVTVGGAGASGGGYFLTYSQDKPFAWSIGANGGLMTLDASTLTLKVGVTFTAPGGSVLLKHAVSEVDAWIFQENAANWGLYWKNNPSGNHTFGGYTSVGAELVGMSAANVSGNGVLTSNFVGATTAYAQYMLSNYTGYIWSASTIFAATSFAGAVPGSSYGSIRVDGTTGGYAGIYLSGASGTVTGMYDTGGNGGNWDPTTGWHFYWHRGNTCLGLGGSTTNSSYRVYANGAMYVSGSLNVGGYLTVNGAGSSSSIYMSDSDEGMREIHCNSNRIGFLNQSSSWGAWCDDSGNWLTPNGVYAGIFYDYDNAGYYLDPNSTSNLLYIQMPHRGNGTPNILVNNGGSENWGAIHIGGGSGNLRIGKSDAGRSWSGRVSLAMHVGADESFRVHSDGWDSLFEVWGSSGYGKLKNSLEVGGSFGTNSRSSASQATISRTFAPQGAANGYNAGTIYAAIKIRLPFRGNDCMWSMKVRIYNYTNDATSEYTIGNYSYSAGSYHRSAYFMGGVSADPKTVRFGNDGSYDCVWIGETSSTWYYPQVSVIDFVGGYLRSDVSTVSNNWDITFVTSFNTVAEAINPQIRFSDVTAVSVNAPSGYVSNGNPWGTANSAFFPNGITTAGGTNWIYGSMTYIGNAPSNGAGHHFTSGGDSRHTGTITPNYIGRPSHSTGYLVGSYNNIGGNSANTNPIYTIGSSYMPSDTSLGGMYGIGYSHPNFWGSGKVQGWGLYVCSNGSIDAIIGGDGASTSIWAKTDIVAYSDSRVKENVEVIPDALDKVKSLRGVTFTRNDVKDKTKRSAGVIAQEVLAVHPEVVSGTEKDMYSVAYGNMAGLFIQAIKEQQVQVESQNTEIAELKELVKQLLAK
jgi:hypothetical protein